MENTCLPYRGLFSVLMRWKKVRGQQTMWRRGVRKCKIVFSRLRDTSTNWVKILKDMPTNREQWRSRRHFLFIWNDWKNCGCTVSQYPMYWPLWNILISHPLMVHSPSMGRVHFMYCNVHQCKEDSAQWSSPLWLTPNDDDGINMIRIYGHILRKISSVTYLHHQVSLILASHQLLHMSFGLSVQV